MTFVPAFSNAFHADAGQPRLELVDATRPAPGSDWDRLARRDLERLQTRAFVHDALLEAQLRSKYALDDAMTRDEPERHFPFNRPKIGERMAKLGEPAVVKYLRPEGRKLDVRTKPRMDKLIAIAPKTASGLLSLPLWRLLNPALIGHVEWHKLGWDHGQHVRATEKEHGARSFLTAAWQVTYRTDGEGPVEHFVGYVGRAPDRAQLVEHLLQLRRWEAAGDLLGYDLALLQALRAARHPSAAPDLKSMQPQVADYIAIYFGAVVVPYPEVNLATQRERIDAGRAAWKDRVLVGPGVGQEGFEEAF